MKHFTVQTHLEMKQLNNANAYSFIIFILVNYAGDIFIGKISNTPFTEVLSSKYANSASSKSYFIGGDEKLTQRVEIILNKCESEISLYKIVFAFL